MTTILKLTITIGKGDQQRTREIAIDPDDVPLGVLEDLETAQETKQWKDIRAAIGGFLELSEEEFRAITASQFMQLAEALQSAVRAATTIPNG